MNCALFRVYIIIVVIIIIIIIIINELCIIPCLHDYWRSM